MKIIQIKGDEFEQIEGLDAKIAYVRQYIEQMHGVMHQNGTSYVAVIEKNDGGIRLISAGAVAKLEEFIADTKGDYKHWSIFTVDTLQ